MNDPSITVYGAYWCPDCRRSKQFLGEYKIPYHWVDIEEHPEGEAFVLEANQGKRIIPTIVFDDGTVLVEPSNADLAAKLGLKTTASRHHYPLVIVGGGPAGLTTALYTAREGIDTLVIEKGAFGGQTAGTERLDNLPGFPDGISGGEFAQRLRQQAERFGVELLQAQDIVGVREEGAYRLVTTASGTEYSAEAVVIATGSRYRRLGVPGENDYLGAGVHFCATCDGPFYRGKHVAVVGGGNSAADESLLLTKFAKHVTLLVRGEALTASKVAVDKVNELENVSVRYHTTVEGMEGKSGKLNGLHLLDHQSGDKSLLDVSAAFIFIGLDPNTGFLKDSNVQRDKWGFVVTGHALVHGGSRPPAFENNDPQALESSVPGIFAAGDCRAGSTKQVASAAGEGAAAAIQVREYLKGL